LKYDIERRIEYSEQSNAFPIKLPKYNSSEITFVGYAPTGNDENEIHQTIFWPME